MERRNITLLLITILVLLLLGGGFWYFYKKSPTTSPTDQFPGGSNTSTRTTETDETPIDEDIPDRVGTLPRLYELHKVPVAGVGFAETKTKKGELTSIVARYIERGLGHIYETDLLSYQASRIVNETRPKIAEALWGNNGSSVVIRFLDDTEDGLIKTRSINIAPKAISLASASLDGSVSDFLRTEEVLLPDHIPFMSVSEDGKNKLFYLEGNTGTTETFVGTSISKIFNSAFTEWLPQFPNENLITLTTRPSAEVPGHLFFLDPKTKAVKKILGGVNGLTTLTSRNGKLVLYSETKDGFPDLFIYDKDKNESHQIYVQTLPEKCVWGRNRATIIYCAVPQAIQSAIYPDQWYQGIISFSDALYEVDALTLSARKILTPGNVGVTNLDMINLALSSNDEYLLFMNKHSLTPWLYNIVEHFPKREVAEERTAPIVSTPATVLASTTATTPAASITFGMKKLR